MSLAHSTSPFLQTVLLTRKMKTKKKKKTFIFRQFFTCGVGWALRHTVSSDVSKLHRNMLLATNAIIKSCRKLQTKSFLIKKLFAIAMPDFCHP